MIIKNKGSYITSTKKDLTKVRDLLSKQAGVSKELVANAMKDMENQVQFVVDGLLETLCKIGKQIDPSMFVSVLGSSIPTFTYKVIESLIDSFKNKDERNQVKEGMIVMLENIKCEVNKL